MATLARGRAMIDRVAPTERPDGPPQGFHKWRTLLFMHWEVDAAALRPLVPEPLAIDTFEGRAFVGLVPFTMLGIRPSRFLPALPGVSAFHEANVRTYVHHEGRHPGVWFFSLDAANSIAVRAARRFWHLPYFRAEMSLDEAGGRVEYRSSRLWPDPVPATLDVAYAIGDDAGPSVPGTLQHFLAERYFLYSQRKNGTVMRGRVHHSAYPLRNARIERLDESLVAAAGIARARDRILPDLFSPGVDVEVFGLDAI
jgi:uncharacterized protein YqjF (DUF2071 family)